MQNRYKVTAVFTKKKQYIVTASSYNEAQELADSCLDEYESDDYPEVEYEYYVDSIEEEEETEGGI